MVTRKVPPMVWMTFVVCVVWLLVLGVLSGCRLHHEIGDTYSKADVDAINARMQCRQVARTMIEIHRCEAQ